MKTKTTVLSVLYVFSVVFASFFIPNSLAKSSPAAQMPPPPVVEVVKVEASTLLDQLTATGTLVSIPGIVVKPEISGRVTNVYFKSGDEVKANTPLLEIYPDILKAQLLQNQAELKLHQLNFDRYAKLYTTHTVSKAEYDQEKANLDSSIAKVAQSQAGLSQTLIKAPFDGRLGVNLVSLGQYINAGQDIVSLQSLDPIYVDFTISEIYASKIAVNQEIKIQSDAYPNADFKGKVVAIDSLVNQNTRSIKVRAEVANKDKKLLPGAFAEVVLFVGSAKQVVKVPQTATIYDPNGNYVYKVVDGKAVKALVTLGARDDQNVIVQSGLVAGDTVITAGQLKIPQEGAAVIIAGQHKEKK